MLSMSTMAVLGSTTKPSGMGSVRVRVTSKDTVSLYTLVRVMGTSTYVCVWAGSRVTTEVTEV